MIASLSAVLVGLAQVLVMLSNQLLAIPPNTAVASTAIYAPLWHDISERCPISQEALKTPQDEIRGIIRQSSCYYGVDTSLALFIAERESRYDEKAVNPISGAGGVFQWLASSWKLMCEGDRMDKYDNIRCAIKTLKEPDGISNWRADPSMFSQLFDAGFIDETGKLK